MPEAQTSAVSRNAASGLEPGIFTRIYERETKIAIWQREITTAVRDAAAELLASTPKFQAAMTVSPQNSATGIRDLLTADSHPALCTDIAELVDMFCCLFDLKRAGLRLTVLNHAMCPRFHVDRVPCRLVTTYEGSATEWLPHHAVNRTKLGARSNGQADRQSGLYRSEKHIQKLSDGDVALLKGELWEQNENAGLVHRSPVVSPGEKRLLLTLDFSN